MLVRPLIGEAADVPSPRTSWSVYSKKELATWQRCHETLRADAQAYVPSAASRLVLIGDSITESWRGTSYGRAVPRTHGVQSVLSETIATRWPSPLALGIAADCTQHLLWRMRQGELSAAMKEGPRLIFVMLIGTNNLGRGHSVAETVRGVVACASHVLNATRGKLLVNAVLPRGDRRKRGPARKRGTSFLPDIRHVNAGVNESVSTSLRAAFPGRAHYVDCGSPFLLREGRGALARELRATSLKQASGDEVVDRTLMPDRVHPNAAGHRLWARCLQSKLEAIDN